MGVNDERADFLDMAQASCDAAEYLLQGGYPGFAASRAYYGMFHAAEAMLERRGLSFSRHSAVISAFGREIVKRGDAPVEFHRHLLDAFDLRNVSEYRSHGSVTADEAREMIRRARAFVDLARRG